MKSLEVRRLWWGAGLMTCVMALGFSVEAAVEPGGTPRPTPFDMMLRLFPVAALVVGAYVATWHCQGSLLRQSAAAIATNSLAMEALLFAADRISGANIWDAASLVVSLPVFIVVGAVGVVLTLVADAIWGSRRARAAANSRVEQTGPRAKTILAWGILGLLGAAIPFLPSTQVQAVDRILFSPLAVFPALAGFICGVVAIRLGVRSWKTSDDSTRWNIVGSILGIGCGVIAILASVAAFFV